MKTEQVPQDNVSTYGGHRKLLYAVNKQGDYKGVRSSGWEVEASATLSAIDEMNRQARLAWQRVHSGRSSALEYHMYRCRMDPALLAQATGLYQWRVKRHFKPRVFARLSNNLLVRYAESLGLTVNNLKQVPAQPEA